MKRNYLLKNASYLDPIEGRTQNTHILLNTDPSGKVSVKMGVGKNDQIKDGTTVFDQAGAFICPGFCDIRCTLGTPFVQGGGQSQDISYAQFGGYSTIAPTPSIDGNFPETPKLFEKYRDRMMKITTTHIIPVAPITKKQIMSKCDILGMAEKGASVFTDVTSADYINDGVLFEAMKDISLVGGLLILSAHNKKIIKDGCMNRGSVASYLGVPGITKSPELMAVMRGIILSYDTGCRVHISGISLGTSVEMIREAKKRGINVTSSVSPPYFYFTSGELLYKRAMAKLMPPLRDSGDVEAIIDGIADGTVDCIESAHVPVSRTAKSDLQNAEFGSMGFESTFPASYTALVRSGRISIYRLIDALSLRPFEILYNKKMTPEDIAHTGFAKLELTEGRTVSDATLHSTRRSCIFDGTYLYGSVLRMFQ